MADEDKITDDVEKDVKAEKDEPTEPAAAEDPAEPETAAEPETPAEHRTLPVPAWVAICVTALVVGVLGGYFLLGGAGAGSVSLDGRTTLSSGELDSTIATYTYNGLTATSSGSATKDY